MNTEMAHPFKTRANSILASVMKVSKVDVALHRVKRVRHIPTSSAVHREWVSLRRGFPTASPRARTEAGEWRRKPHVKVPSPRTAARRMSPRPFHGARQIGGKESTRSAARARRGQRKLPQTERGVFAQARLATNCTPARASLRDSLSLSNHNL